MNATYKAIVDFLQSNPGSGRGKIGAYVNIKPEALTKALVALTATGLIQRKGVRRSATYEVTR